MNLSSSDHCGLWLRTHAKGAEHHKPYFKFLSSWLAHPDFDNQVHNSWRLGSTWSDNITRFTETLIGWNKRVFGNIFQRKKRILSRLEGINKKLMEGETPRLLSIKGSLWQEYTTILHEEEAYWFQQARSNWICLGDRKTRFFHSSTLAKRIRKKIEAMLDSNGNWVYDDKELQVLVTNFFQSLYTSVSLNHDSFLATTNNFPVLQDEISTGLTSPISFEETTRALFQMGNYKAPGSDGIHAMFYKSKWDVVGPIIYGCIREAYENPSSIKHFNQTLLTLVPKSEDPTTPVQFRPIALCNVIYKILTKVLSNRMQSFLPALINKTQCSFVPGRHMVDNAIILQEVIHSMAHHKGSKGYMIIKLDLEKAYDRLEWSFIKRSLHELHLPEHLVEVITHGISSSTMSINL